MRHHLKQCLKGKPFVLPKFTTMSRFMAELDDATLAGNTELLFVMYNAYCEVLEKHGLKSQIREFDSFAFWGDTLVRDFDDIDAYLVDCDQIFKNIKDYHEIQTDYLTDEEKKAIEETWGYKMPKSPIGTFWKHTIDASGQEGVAHKFVTLWELMGDIYKTYRRMLAEHSPALTYSGAIYRNGYEHIRSMSEDEFDYQKYVFIGFNRLSTAQSEIFNNLQNRGLAEFFWDIASDDFYDDNIAPNAFDATKDIKGNRRHWNYESRATKYIRINAKKHPMPHDFCLGKIENRPQVDIYGVSSKSAQAKIVNAILRKTAEKSEKSLDIETAIVLPETSLLSPILYSIPQQVAGLNITMGMPFRATSMSTLLSALIALQIHARKVSGQYAFFHEDIVRIASHPNVAIISNAQCNALINHIAKDRKFEYTQQELNDIAPLLGKIFDCITNPNDANNVNDYLQNIFSLLNDKYREIEQKSNGTEDYYEDKIIGAFSKTTADIYALSKEYGIKLNQGTYFSLLQRQMQHLTLSMQGTPLHGLQIMGVLETRSLDFENVIITSMNERIFPYKAFKNSLIPHNLRRGYGLPGIESQEADYAYHFYRLISRARNVSIVYDTRSGIGGAGELSRYVVQLSHIPHGAKINNHFISLSGNASNERVLSIKKSPKVIEELKQFFPGGNKRISASSLKEYKNCPFLFYIKNVKGLWLDEDTEGYIPPHIIGTAIHNTMENLYKPYAEQTITPDIIDSMLENDILHMLKCEYNNLYYHGRYTGKEDDIPGEASVLSDHGNDIIRRILSEEKAFTPYTFVAAEKKITAPWKLTDDLTVNFTMKIDRIDQLTDGTLRFIDYKTGDEELYVGNIEKLVHDNKYGGVFQTLLYAIAYSELENFEGPIQPKIYNLIKLYTDGLPPITHSVSREKTPILDHRPLIPVLRKDFVNLISSIFDPEIDFNQTDKPANCKYCSLRHLCQRESDPDKLY